MQTQQQSEPVQNQSSAADSHRLSSSFSGSITRCASQTLCNERDVVASPQLLPRTCFAHSNYDNVPVMAHLASDVSQSSDSTDPSFFTCQTSQSPARDSFAISNISISSFNASSVQVGRSVGLDQAFVQSPSVAAGCLHLVLEISQLGACQWKVWTWLCLWALTIKI